jgi:hypothetical protein
MEIIQSLQQNSSSWLFFVKASFAIAVSAMGMGIFFLPTDLWVKGYMSMGTLFVIGSTFTLAKTLRDEFEGKKLINKIQDAKTEKMLREYDADTGSL